MSSCSHSFLKSTVRALSCHCAIVAIVFLLATVVSATTFTVTKIADTNDGGCNADCSLREAIAAANGASSTRQG